MKTTRYFEEQMLGKRPYVERSRCEAAIAAPIRSETQPDGRIRFWPKSLYRAKTRRVCQGR